MPKPFIAYDGRGSEVLIESGEGVIEEFEVKSNTTQVKVKDSNPQLAHLNGGWIKNDDPIYDYIKQAYEEKRTVAYRIEIQRKDGVDVNMPIREARGENDMAKAKKNTIKIIGAIDGKSTSEAVTDPSQDSVGRIKAGVGDSSKTSSAPTITLPQLGTVSRYLTPETLPLATVLAGASKDATSAFLAEQSTGMAQMTGVAASFLAEVNTAFGKEVNGDIASLSTIAQALMWIADSVQVTIFRLPAPNRIDAVHAHLREMAVATLLARPQGAKKIATRDMEETTAVGMTVYGLYNAAMEIARKGVSTSYMSFNGDQSPAQEPAHQEPEQNAPQSAPEPQEEPQREEEPQEPVQEEQRPVEPAQDSAPPIFLLSKDEISKSFKDAESAGSWAGPEATDGFIKLASGIAQQDYPAISEFLDKLFGVRKISDLPDELLSGLVEFYRSTGNEQEASAHFAQAVFYVANGNL